MAGHLLFFFTLFFSRFVLAHPVIYKDGIVVSSANMHSFSDNQLMYSWSNRWASGINYFRFSKNDQHTELILAKTNYLLHRSNKENFQSNIYLHGGVGLADSEIEKRATKYAYMTGIDMDWETRNLYTSFKYYYFNSPDVSSISMMQGRIGLSPYEAGFDQIQTWFMIQGMYLPVTSREVMITPLVRFFYKNVLWEWGASTRGDWLLNFMFHF
jgi:hypothetical protein